MEFLKEIFGDGSLTYDELAAKLKDNKDIKLANLAGGMYVDKRKLTDKENELAAANQKINGLEKAVKEFDGVDVKALNAQIKTLQDKYDTDVAGLKLNSALDMALVNAKAHDVKAVKPFLDMSLIKMDGDKLTGFEEQLKNLQKEKSFLFSAPPDGGKDGSNGGAHFDTGGSHGNNLDVGGNAFLNAVKQAAGLPKKN